MKPPISTLLRLGETPWLDTSGRVRPLLIAVFGWVAEQERLRISERTKAGLDRARRAGKKLGEPGFDIDVVRAQALREAGKSYRRIAAELGVSVGKAHESLAGPRTVRQTSIKTPTEEAPILGFRRGRSGAECVRPNGPFANAWTTGEVRSRS